MGGPSIFFKRLYRLPLEKRIPILCSPYILSVYFSDGHDFKQLNTKSDKFDLSIYIQDLDTVHTQ